MSENSYLNLLADVMTHGDRREGRNGVVRSLFGHQLKFDLAQGFPLLTTKKVHFKSIALELLWFISGNTNAKWLEDQGVTIWKSWGDPETREMGPIYSHQWRTFGSPPRAVPQRTPRLREGVSATYLGVANGAGKEGHPLAKTWEGMIARCYDPSSASYSDYGARGVYVCDRWLEFSAFAEDAYNLPNGRLKKSDTAATRYVLDKDARGSGFVYSAETCCWVTDAENARFKDEFIYTLAKDGRRYSFTNITDFCAQQGIPTGNISDLWTGRKNAQRRHGFEFISKEPIRKGVDQLQGVIDILKSDPFGRRHIVSAWNPAEIPEMALPPCHCLFQFFVTSDARLHCQLYQRSADLFLGVPFNIASYALLTHMVGQVTGLTPGHLIIQFGDVHLYEDHLSAAATQLGRSALPLPTISVAQRQRIDDYVLGDFTLQGYEPYPAIPAPVSK